MQSFTELVRRYDVVFFDAYGVLKNTGGVLKGVPAMLEALRQALRYAMRGHLPPKEDYADWQAAIAKATGGAA